MHPPAKERAEAREILPRARTTQPDDAAGREKQAAALRQAIALLDESTAEAKQLSEERELRRLIDEELATLGRK